MKHQLAAGQIAKLERVISIDDGAVSRCAEDWRAAGENELAMLVDEAETLEPGLPSDYCGLSNR